MISERERDGGVGGGGREEKECFQFSPILQTEKNITNRIAQIITQVPQTCIISPDELRNRHALKPTIK